MMRRQRGVALLTAVLVVALATVLIAMLLDQGNVSLARTRNILRAQQAESYALGLEAFAIDLLRRDAGSDVGRDTRGDIWAQPLPPTPVPGGVLNGSMRDLNGCFNLNNLVAGDQRDQIDFDRFVRLLRALKLDPELAQAVLDWIDAGAQPEIRGAEDQFYLVQRPAYRSANRPFVHVSELRLVRGVNRDVYAALLPHVCTLPAPSAINVNTATIPVLMALSDTLTEASARQLGRDGNASYGSVAEFQDELLRLNVIDVPDHRLAVQSTYFDARAEVTLDGIPFGFNTVVERSAGVMRVVSRAPGF